MFQTLLDTEFWLIGRDIEHPRGNLLPDLGFVREPVPEDGYGPSRYRRTTEGEHVLLWVWGIYLELEGAGLLLTRGDNAGTYAVDSPPDGHEPPTRVPRQACDARALAGACGWFAAYEERVTMAAGVGHRVPRPGSRPSLAPPEPWSLSAAWQELGNRIVRSTLPAAR